MKKEDIEQIVRTVSKESEDRLQKSIADSEKRTQHMIGESEDRTQRYMGALQEDFQSKLDLLVEFVQPLPQMQEQLNNLTERVSVIEVDIKGLKREVTDLAAIVNDMKPQLDATFEKVGEIAVTVDKIVIDHEKRFKDWKYNDVQ